MVGAFTQKQRRPTRHFALPRQCWYLLRAVFIAYSVAFLSYRVRVACHMALYTRSGNIGIRMDLIRVSCGFACQPAFCISIAVAAAAPGRGGARVYGGLQGLRRQVHPCIQRIAAFH